MIHNNEVISIEEDLLNCRQMIRRFTFNNRNNGLKIGVLTIGASLVSCELSSHQIVVQNMCNTYDSSPHHRTNWVSHVRGADTLCLTAGISSSQSQSVVYQLTQENHLILIGRFKTQQHLFCPFFFNLNCATNKTSLEGHYLHIRSSDSSALIRQQINTNNGSNCGEDNGLNFMGETACALPVTDDDTNDYDFDAVYCLTSADTPDAQLLATLRYESRTVEVVLQSNGQQSQASTPQSLQLQTQASNQLNLKLRIRITNGAVCIIPALMNEFKCIYKFFW